MPPLATLTAYATMPAARNSTERMLFAMLGDMSEDVRLVAEKNELHASVRANTLQPPSPADPAVPIHSDQIPEEGPTVCARGVRWATFAPAGYKTLTAHNANGELVMHHMVKEELIDDGLVDRAWAWLEQQCPETIPVATSRLPMLRLLA